MRPLERITSWLCFVAALFMGVSPAQSFVLCLEPDGCVSLELPAAPGDDCRDCDVHAVEGVEIAQPVLVAEDECCPCVDLQVPGVTKDQLVRAKRIEPSFDPSITVPVAIQVQPRVTVPLADFTPARSAPRPSDSLHLIRSVVLLV